MLDLVRIDRFLAPEVVGRILAALRLSDAETAPVYGVRDRIDLRIRRTARLTPPAAIVDEARSLLVALTPEIEEHFATGPLTLEPLQFLRYREGDYFVAHQDGNTPLIRDDSNDRRVSVVIFLDPESHTGGEFVIHTRDERTVVEPAAGTLIAFRSETTHEVTPVTSGERFTIVGWYRVAAV